MILTFGEYLDALKKAGVPCTKPTIKNYEKKGVIREADRLGPRKDRIYNPERIQEDIDRINKYRAKSYNQKSD